MGKWIRLPRAPADSALFEMVEIAKPMAKKVTEPITTSAASCAMLPSVRTPKSNVATMKMKHHHQTPLAGGKTLQAHLGWLHNDVERAHRFERFQCALGQGLLCHGLNADAKREVPAGPENRTHQAHEEERKENPPKNARLIPPPSAKAHRCDGKETFERVFHRRTSRVPFTP